VFSICLDRIPEAPRIALLESGGPRLVPVNAPPFRSPLAAPWRRALGHRWTVASLAIGAFLALPIGVVVAHLLVPGGEAWRHLSATVLPEYIESTLLLLAAVLVGVCAVGVGCAWLVATCDFPGRRAFEWALLLPLAMPAYVMAYAYTDLLQFSGPLQTWMRAATGWGPQDFRLPEIRSLGGASLMFTFALYPYVYLLSRVAFAEQSASLAEAGRTLGLSPWASFVRVSLPLARPSIAAGTALALMETLADFGTVSYFGVQTFTTGIFRAWLSMGEPASAAKLSVVLLVFVAVLLGLERALRRGARFEQAAGPALRKRWKLEGFRAVGAIAGCVLPLALGFAVPASHLAVLSASQGSAAWGERFFQLVINTTLLATVTALIAVAVALLLAYGARISRNPLAAGVNRAAGLGYALPGAVIAIGVLIPATRLDHWIADLAAAGGLSLGLVFTGSVGALVYAYLIRFLAVALQSVEAGLARITPHMEDAARSLGLGVGETLARVHVPMMRSSLVTAALLVFVDVMKELPATFVMRPFNFDTLAVQAFHFASDERLPEAAAASLAIVAVGLVPLVIASRRLVAAR
jgi:iron(III) transport system permease protein